MSSPLYCGYIVQGENRRTYVRLVHAVAAIFVVLIAFAHGHAWAVDCHLNNACLDISECLKEGVQNDVARIREGMRTGNGHQIWEGADACWTNFHKHDTWKSDTAGCSDNDYRRAGQWTTNSCQGDPPP